MENDYDYNKMLCGNSFTDFYDEYIKILKLINVIIKRLENKEGLEYKIKHIKKYYRIIRSLEGVVRILFYKKESYISAITEMYKFLYEMIVKMICDIYEHIKFFQDDDYNEMEYYEYYLRFNGEEDSGIYKLYNVQEWSDKFKFYTKLLHFI